MDDVLADKHGRRCRSSRTARGRRRSRASTRRSRASTRPATAPARRPSRPSRRRPSSGASPSRRDAGGRGVRPQARPARSTSCARLLQRTLESLPAATAARPDGPYDRNEVPPGSIVISGTGLGLPGADKPVMDPKNAARILARRAVHRPGAAAPPRGDGPPARHAARQDGGRQRALRDDRRPEGRHQARRARRARSTSAAEYGVPEKLVEALDSTTPARDGRGPRRAARGGDPARPDLEEDDHRQVPARALDAAGVDARRDGRRLRERLPRLRPLRRRGAPLLHVREPAGAEAAARGAARDDAGGGHPLGDLAADRRARRAPREGALRLRPALPAPHPHDGPQPVRRVHRRPRAQHARQRGLRLDRVRPSPSPRTGSARAAAAAWSSWPPTTSRATP